FYGVILALAASGIATNIMGGVVDALASGAPIPSLDDVPPRAVHGMLAWTFMMLLVFHIGAALYHQFIRRDNLLARMGIGRKAGNRRRVSPRTATNWSSGTARQKNPRISAGNPPELALRRPPSQQNPSPCIPRDSPSVACPMSRMKKCPNAQT